MSKTIDERVVQMRFDNKDFESNVQTSLGTIGRLKQSLNFSNSSKSLENISTAAKNVNMNPLSNAVETVKLKFSALEVMAMTALSNITNTAVNAGKRIVSSLTESIKMGFKEYETQINAVQTILANTSHSGTTLEDVNKALDELNLYADKTIYNFTEMTRNIGTFTAAGLGLEESTTAIKGIANLAAVSGSNSQQASTAMYQLSQALANGTVNLQDWNSVVNAGMGGKVFQDALIRTAAALKGVSEEAFRAENITTSFRESIGSKDGTAWLSAEILSKTLQQFSGDLSDADLASMGFSEKQIADIQKMAKVAEDAATKVKTFTQLWDTLKESAQSGWTQSWEIIIGDFEEAKEMLTTVSDTLGNYINKSAEARNKVLSDWKELGGRTALIESIKNIFEGLVSVVKPIKEAFSEIFPPITGLQLANFTKGLQNLTDKFKISDKTADNLKRTFKGLFSIFDIGKNFSLSLFEKIGITGLNLPNLADGFLSVTAVIGDYITGIAEVIDKTDFFGKILSTVSKLLKPFSDKFNDSVSGIKKFFDGIKTLDSGVIDGVVEKINSGFDKITSFSDIIKSAFDGVIKIYDKVTSVAGKAFDKIVDSLNSPSVDKASGFLNGGLMTGLLYGLKKIIDSLSNIASGGNFLESITGILDDVRGCLKAYQTQLKADALIKIASAIGILAGSLLVLSMIDPSRLTSALVGMGVLIAELMGSMIVFDKLSGDSKFGGITKVATSMILLSTAMLILSNAMVKMGELDWNEIAKGLTSVAGMAAVLVASSKFMSGSSGKMISTATGLVIFAGAMKVLSDVVIKLGNIDTGSLTKGLVGVGILCAELAVFLKVTDLDGMGLLKGLGLMTLATSIMILSNAVDKFATMDTGALIQGLLGVAGVLAELAIFVQLTGDSSKVVSTAIGMTILGAAMLVLAEAVERMGNLSWEQIGKGLLTMALGLTSIVLALNLMPDGVFTKSAGMVLFASSLLILANAVEQMGNLSWEQIAKGLITLAGALTIITVAIYAINGAIPGALGMIVMATAINILVPALEALGNMTVGEIVKSLIALAGAFVVIGAAALILSPITPLIALLGGAIALLGVGCLAAGNGVLAFSTGLATLAGLGAVGIQTILTLINGFLDLIPVFIARIGEGVIAFAQVIIEGAPIIAEAIVTVITEVCSLITNYIPVIAETVVSLLVSILSTIAEYTPQFIEKGTDIVVGFIEGIGNTLPRIVEKAIELITNFIKAIGQETPKVVDAGMKMIVDFINGLADAIESNGPLLVSAIDRLMKSVIKTGISVLTQSISNFRDVGTKIMNSGLVQGIKSKVSDCVSTVREIPSKCVSAIRNGISTFTSAGRDLIAGLANGIRNGASAAINAVKNVATSVIAKAKALFKINSPSKVFEEMGKYNSMGLAKGLEKYAYLSDKASENVGSGAVEAMNKTLSKLSVDNINSQPTIRPIFDMSAVEEGANAINGLFANSQTLALGVSGNANINSITSGMRNNISTTNDDVVSAIKDLKNTITKHSGDSYNINGITYDDGSNITDAVKSIVRAARIERRI